MMIVFLSTLMMAGSFFAAVAGDYAIKAIPEPTLEPCCPGPCCPWDPEGWERAVDCECTKADGWEPLGKITGQTCRWLEYGEDEERPEIHPDADQEWAWDHYGPPLNASGYWHCSPPSMEPQKPADVYPQSPWWHPLPRHDPIGLLKGCTVEKPCPLNVLGCYEIGGYCPPESGLR